MKLKIKRSQKSGLTSVVFMLDVMAELDTAEANLVSKYKLGKQIVYQSDGAAQNAAAARGGDMAGLGGMILDKMLKRRFTVNDLVNGQHLECKDLAEVIAAEAQVHDACQNLKQYLDIATSFDGREVIIDIAAE